MRIAVSADGPHLDAPASPVFGRCPVLVFVDPETMAHEAVENPAANAAGGAGIQTANLVVEKGAQAVVTGHVGPNALEVLQAAQVAIYSRQGGTVRQAVEAWKELTALQSEAAALRQRLAELVERIERLEKES